VLSTLAVYRQGIALMMIQKMTLTTKFAG